MSKQLCGLFGRVAGVRVPAMFGRRISTATRAPLTSTSSTSTLTRRADIQSMRLFQLPQPYVRLYSTDTFKLPSIEEAENQPPIEPLKDEPVEYDAERDAKLQLICTCSKCEHRFQKTFSKVAYTKGVVIIQCPGCKSLHLIADNIGWMGDGNWSIEQMQENFAKYGFKQKEDGTFEAVKQN